MKLKFKSFYEINCFTNDGIQYFNMEDVPFKIGDYVKFTPTARNHFPSVPPKAISRVTAMKFNHMSSLGKNNILININTLNDSICCSWVVPLISRKKQL
jgi:hypothetical protein